MAKFNHIDVRGTKKVPSAFGNVFISADSISAAKTVTFPDGYLNGATPEPNLAFKVVFANGHNAANASSYLSLNGVVVVSNQNGTLAPLPIHEMTEGGSTVYKVLNANTVLELYYTEDYDGSSHPAFVVVGNPLVLSSSTYSIYADGKSNIEIYSTTETKTNKVWIDGKPIYRRTFEVYKNNALNGWTRSGNAFTYQGNDLSIDELISNSAITTNGILTMWVSGTYGMDNPYGISHSISGSNHVWTIINSDGGQFSGTKCILTIEYTKA